MDSSRPRSDLSICILGAGCSVCGGYPLAVDIPRRLERFAQNCGDDAKEIKRCVELTLSLMKQHDVTTVDALAQAISQGDHRKELRQAKLATNAYFLSIEEAAIADAYPHYQGLFERLFDFGTSHRIAERVKSSRCRVLTYNYDRLFEQCFLKWASRVDPESLSDLKEQGHTLMNTGLGKIENTQIDPDRFALIKLHGGVGQFHRDNDYGFRYPYWPSLHAPIPEASDANFYARSGHERDTPLIVFPHEKPEPAKAQSPDRLEWSFPLYSDGIWKAASELCAQAEEIRLIGYSMQFIDLHHFKYHLIRAAKHCRKIIVQNRESEKGRLTEILTNIKRELSADWEIEFDPREF